MPLESIFRNRQKPPTSEEKVNQSWLGEKLKSPFQREQKVERVLEIVRSILEISPLDDKSQLDKLLTSRKKFHIQSDIERISQSYMWLLRSAEDVDFILFSVTEEKVPLFRSLFQSDRRAGSIIQLFSYSQNKNILQLVLSNEFSIWWELERSDEERFPNIDVLTAFANHRRRLEIMRQISSKDFCRLVGRNGYLYEVWIQAILDHPEVIQLELAHMNDEKGEATPWSKRIEMIDHTTRALQLGGIKNIEMSYLLFNDWNPDQEQILSIISRLNIREKKRLQKLLGLTGEKEITYPDLLQGSRTLGVPIKNILYEVMKSHLLSELQAGNNGIETRKRNAQRIRASRLEATPDRKIHDFLESPMHPLSFRVTHGPEIEYNLTPGINGYYIQYFLKRHGIHYGGGGGGSPLEFAPGPFRDPETASATLMAWIDGFLFDWNAEYSQTLHFSTGVPIVQNYHKEFVILLEALGYTFPRIEHVNGQKDMFRIFSKGSGKNARAECKDFEVTTPVAVLEFFRIASMLGTAYKAYMAKMSRDLFIKAEGKVTVGLHRQVEQLSKVWEEVRQDLLQLLSQRETLGELVDSAGTSPIARDFAKRVFEVFPTPYERDFPENVELVQDGDGYTVGDVKYQNIVHASRAISQRAEAKIAKIYLETETGVYAAISELLRVRGNHKIFRKKSASFFKKFPWLAPNHVGMNEAMALQPLTFEGFISNTSLMERRIEQLAQFYAQYGKVVYTDKMDAGTNATPKLDEHIISATTPEALGNIILISKISDRSKQKAALRTFFEKNPGLAPSIRPLKTDADRAFMNNAHRERYTQLLSYISSMERS